MLPKRPMAFQAESPSARAHQPAAADRRGIRRLRFGQFVDWLKCRHVATERLQVFLCYLPDSEVVDPLAGLQFCSQPTRRLSSSCPSLGRPVWIPKLRNDGWIWTLPCRRTLALRFDATLELLQAIFEHALLREQRGCKPRGYFFVECPQLIRGHRFEVIPVHDRPQS